MDSGVASGALVGYNCTAPKPEHDPEEAHTQMSDVLNLYLISGTITPHKIEAGIAVIVVVLIVIGVLVYMRRRSPVT